MMTTGSTRGKCSAEQAGHERDQPPRTISVAWPQLAQKRWRECQRARLIAAANSGASASCICASNGMTANGCVAGSASAEKRGASPSKPRKSAASPTSCHSRRPPSAIAGIPSRQASSRASPRLVNSAILSGYPRSASARSRPGPEKKGSGGMPTLRKRELDGSAVERRESRLLETVDRLPPTFAFRLGTRNDREVEREGGEEVPHGADRVDGSRCRRRPIASW